MHASTDTDRVKPRARKRERSVFARTRSSSRAIAMPRSASAGASSLPRLLFKMFITGSDIVSGCGCRCKFCISVSQCGIGLEKPWSRRRRRASAIQRPAEPNRHHHTKPGTAGSPGNKPDPHHARRTENPEKNCRRAGEGSPVRADRRHSHSTRSPQYI